MDQNQFSEETPVSSSPHMNSEPQHAELQSGPSYPIDVPLLPPPKRHLMRWIVISVVVLVILALLYMFRGVFVAATVNGRFVSRFAVIRVLERQLGAQVLDSLVNQTLIEGAAGKAGIAVSAEEIQAELETLNTNLVSQGTDLEAALRAQGVSKEQLENDIRLRKLAEKLLGDKIAVSDEEVDAYMKSNKELLPPGESEDATRNTVRNMLRQQKFSATFEEWLTAAKAEADVSYWKEY